jgi:hypothetical protein
MNAFDARTLDPGDVFLMHGERRLLLRTRQIVARGPGYEVQETEFLHSDLFNPEVTSYAHYPHGMFVEVPVNFPPKKIP